MSSWPLRSSTARRSGRKRAMTEHDGAPVRSASMMVAARVINLGLGLLSIPVLIRYLGGDAFAAWALLLALSVGFSTLELAMGPTLIRFLTLPMHDASHVEARTLV